MADLIALIKWHRRRGAGLLQSIRGAMRCWMPSNPKKAKK